MSLSEHERTQFDRLTSGLAAEDPSLVNRLEKSARSITMTHFSPEDVWMVALGALVLAIAALVLGFVTGNFLQATIGFTGACAVYPLWRRYPNPRKVSGKNSAFARN